MSRPPHRLILLHSHRLLLAAVEDIAPGRYDVHRVAGWEEVPPLADAPTVLLVADPYHGAAGAGPSPALRELLRALPLLPAVVAIAPSRRWLEDLRLLGAWGVEEILDLTSEATPAALRRRLAQAGGRPLRRLLRCGLSASTPPRARLILERAAEVAAEGGGPVHLARALSMHRDSLHRWCVADGLPPPRALFTWMRLLLAAEMLDHSPLPLTRVAIASGYASDGALRAALHRWVGAGTRELRRRGAFAMVSANFLARLERSGRDRAARAAAHRSPGGG
jgi:AraC-like DNA-binding protein